MRPFFGVLLMGATASAVLASTPYPDTPVRPVQDRYHGVTVSDPYRWMEDMRSAEFQQWLKAQAQYASAGLQTLPGRTALRERLGQLMDAGVSTGGYAPTAGQILFLKREPGQNQRRLWLREGLAGPERQVLDPLNVPGLPGKHSIDFYSASPDGKRVALGLSAGGSEDSTLVVLDLARGELLSERIPHAGLNQYGVSWLADGSGFFYNRHPQDERYNKSAVYFHRLGADWKQDRPVFGWGTGRGQGQFEIADLPYVYASKGSRWAVAELLHGDAVDRSYFVAPLADLLQGQARWKRVIAPKDRVTKAVLDGERLLALSQRQDPRRALLVYPAAGGKPQTLLAPSQQVLLEIEKGEGQLLVRGLDGGVSRLTQLDLNGKAAPQTLTLPFEGTVREMAALPDGEWLLRMDGWVNPAQTLVVRAGQPARAVDLQPQASYPLEGLSAERVMVKSHDGVQVPLSIVHPKGHAGMARPTILTGYGAYGMVMEPGFRPSRLGWLEQGGRFAVCHVRGGGELGEAWHRGAHIVNKQNTVSDFIACARYLIAKGYTSPQLLAGTGGSAGGITIGGAINQAPELFAAAQAAVGVSDMLRMELTPNGAPNIAEFGTVKSPRHFKAMFALSPFHNVKDGQVYPAVIVTTGANDPRVDAWMPAKFAARLQAATAKNAAPKPVWLRVDYEAGHGMGSSVSSQLDEQADVWSFFLWQMGHPAYQPAAAAKP
ncbi:prolyl oligopeptidase [Inhella inkyongensis]|uniref:prolyl oligopeptidase n=1 Tax=Inhella inkyongensis TaxID=392593 RepID=A0A840S256_9BURK|nr:prolyl oligopeptidase family serine peptidase [Inhella inkyongensis]MBB5203498.1 prolyl oligopeptidase [Inhella inkyongensis]